MTIAPTLAAMTAARRVYQSASITTDKDGWTAAYNALQAAEEAWRKAGSPDYAPDNTESPAEALARLLLHGTPERPGPWVAEDAPEEVWVAVRAFTSGDSHD